MPETPPERVDGYAPIGSYAAIGDGRTVALVAADGAIDWLPLPTLDAHPTFAAVLDPDTGGAITFAPTAPFTVERHYVQDTNVLASTFHTDDGSVRVTDAVNTGRSGPLPWSELARLVEGLTGCVPMRWQVAPGTAIGPLRPWAWWHGAVPMLDVGQQHLALRLSGVGEPVLTGAAVHGETTVRAGDRGLLAIIATAHEPTLVPGCAEIDDRIEHTVADWQRWCTGIAYDGPWREAVLRSALALKLLISTPSGAIAGAATTSLPEALGGQRNWDYRFTWIRDSSFALDALANLDLHEELHGALSSLLSAVARTAPDLRAFYTLAGGVPGAHTEELPVRGYRDSTPALAGNGAAAQTQLGNFGDLFDAVFRYTSHGAVLDPPTATMLAGLADRACDIWGEKDAGIWELGDYQHYTISKIGCWVALDRAARLADAGQLSSWHAPRWRYEAQQIRNWVNAHCWSSSKRAYTFYAGTDELDASVLLAARTGFAEPDDPRLADTIDAVLRDLTEGPLLYRYGAMRGKEGCFVACSFWLMQALTHVGRLAEAARLMDQLVEVSNDVGLLSEEIDSGSGDLLGNFPQALSHLSLITAAVDYTRHTRSRAAPE